MVSGAVVVADSKQVRKELGKTSGATAGILMVRVYQDVTRMVLTRSTVVFAQQGYFILAINPTGSTTYGQGIVIIQSRGHDFISFAQNLRTQLREIGEASHL